MTKLKTFLLPALAVTLLAASPVLAKGHGDDGAISDALFTAVKADGSVTIAEMTPAQICSNKFAKSFEGF